MKGTVEWFNDARGYGAIQPDGHDGVVYVHFTAIETPGYKTLEPGTRVRFDVDASAEKFSAVNVRSETSTNRAPPDQRG